jgi:hypothetical protein
MRAEFFPWRGRPDVRIAINTFATSRNRQAIKAKGVLEEIL